MISLRIYAAILLLLASCQKQPEEVPAPYGVPYINTPIDTPNVSGLTFNNTTWILRQFRIGNLGGQQNASDTLLFQGVKTLYYNGIITQYASYKTPAGINLTLYESPWGTISGEVYPYNLQQGKIIGIAFKNILNPNNQSVYLWMDKLK